MNALGRFGRSTGALAAIAALALAAGALAAHADNLVNSLVAPDTVAVTAGSPAVVGFTLNGAGGDGGLQGGGTGNCNVGGVGDGRTATVTFTSTPGGVVSPTLSFDSCSSLNGSFSAPVGTYSVVANSPVNVGGAQGSYNTSGAAFTLIVTANDSTPPVVTPNVAGTLGDNDWYTSDVSVSWSVTEPESTVTSTTGCTSSSVTSDTTGVTFTCSATSAGGTASQSVTVKRDGTVPVIGGSVSPSRPGSGWWNQGSGAPTAGFVCSDATSGVATCEPDHVFGEGEDQSKTGTVTDNAGNTATDEVANIDVDLTAPTADAALSGDEGDDGWFVGDINVDWTVTDALSGPVPASCPDTIIAADGQDNVTCTPQDNAGNTGTAVLKPYKRDATPPTITATLDRAADTVTGWFNTTTGAPTVSYTCNDHPTGSGLKSCTEPHPFTEGENLTHTGTAKDNAGNTTTATTTNIDVDLTPPTINYTLDGTLGTNNWYTTDVTINWTTTDTGSGINTGCTNQTLTTDTANHTFTCTATDNAGNTNTQTTTIKRDATAPTATPDVTGTLGANGWYTSDISVAWQVNDGTGSGVASETGCEPGSVTADTAGEIFSCAATDEAGNTSSPQTVTIKRDATKPDLGAAQVTGTLGDNEWYTSDVNVMWSPDDATSGIDTVSGCSQLVTDDTTGFDVVCVATDRAGNTKSETVTVKRDGTVPVIGGSVSPSRPGSGWWNQGSGAPTAGFVCSDATSGVATCEPDHVFGEGEDQSKTGTVTDNAGNTATDEVANIDVDLTAPTADAALSGDEGDDGWFVGDINVDWTVTDALSGPVPASCPDTIIAADGQDNVTCTPQDNAGNTGTAVLKPYKRDATPPTITATLDRAADTVTGWFNTTTGAPTVSYTCNDHPTGSGLKSCTEPHPFTEGENLTHTGTAKDNAGNTTTATTTNIDVDLTPPTINYTLDGTLGTNNWYTTDVTINWTTTDTGSGINTGCTNQTLTTDTANHTFTCTATDNAGNTNTQTTTIKRDATNPVVEWSSLINDGDSFYYGSVPVTPTCTASDDLSGVTAQGCLVSGYGTAVGSHTMSATAADKAGNVTTANRSYTVLGWTASGFYRPVEMNALNTVKGGSTVPLKFEAFAGPTELTDVATTVKSYNIATIPCASVGTLMADPIEELASTGGTTLRYDWVGGQFIQNWKTLSKAGVCYQTTVKLHDGSRLDAYFKTK